MDIVRESPLGIPPFRDITLGLPSRCKLCVKIEPMVNRSI